MAARCVFTLMIFQVTIAYCCAANGMIWHKQKQEFVQLFSIPQFAGLAGKENLAKYRAIEMHNFNKEIVKGTYAEVMNIAMFYDNGTKVTGINGDIWNLLADYLNFTFIPLKAPYKNFGEQMENGSYNGLIGMLMRNETQVILTSLYLSTGLDIVDYTTPLWTTKFHIYIRPIWLYDNSWVFTLFSPIIWYSIIFLLIILSLVSYFLQNIPVDYKSKHRKEDTINFSLGDHIFYSYSIMCAQGYTPDALHHKIKILSVLKNIFAWLILLSYSSHLIYQMANKNPILPFKDLETFFNNTKHILLIYGSSSTFRTHKNASRGSNQRNNFPPERVQYINLEKVQEMYNKICYNGEKYAMFELESRFMLLNKYSCPFEIVGNFDSNWIVSILRKDFRYKRTIDIALIKIKEVGLLDVLKTRWMNNRLEKITKNNVFESVDIQQVYLIFLVLYYGTIISLIILVLEYIKYNHQKTRIKRPIGKLIIK